MNFSSNNINFQNNNNMTDSSNFVPPMNQMNQINQMNQNIMQLNPNSLYSTNLAKFSTIDTISRY